MNLATWADSPAWTTAGWIMLHFLWVGAALTVVAGLGRLALRKAHPDVRHGYALATRIRALPGVVGRVPVIGISGRARSDDEQAARDAGMNAYLVKPVSPSKLQEALSALTAR